MTKCCEDLKKDYIAVTDKWYEIDDSKEARIKGSEISFENNVSAEDWVFYIKNSDFVVTDSFHGVCFAIIYHKDFAAVCNKARGKDRFDSLLSMLGLQSRLYEDASQIDVGQLTPIDYEKVDRQIGRNREKSMQWLINALQIPVDPLLQNDYDILRREIIAEKRGLTEKIEKLKGVAFRTNLMVSYNERISKKVNLSKRMACGRTDNMTTILWGAGDCFNRNIERIKQSCDVRFVCDNDPDKWGRELAPGVKCLSPAKLREMEDVFVVIMVDSAGVTVKIVNQLMDMGIVNFTHFQNIGSDFANI